MYEYVYEFGVNPNETRLPGTLTRTRTRKSLDPAMCPPGRAAEDMLKHNLRVWAEDMLKHNLREAILEGLDGDSFFA